jgi:hypothetical protein
MGAIETIERIGSIVNARKAEWIASNPKCEYVPFDTDFLTTEERSELHEAKMQLPSTGELAQQASERLKAKVAARKTHLDMSFAVK